MTIQAEWIITAIAALASAICAIAGYFAWQNKLLVKSYFTHLPHLIESLDRIGEAVKTSTAQTAEHCIEVTRQLAEHCMEVTRQHSLISEGLEQMTQAQRSMCREIKQVAQNQEHICDAINDLSKTVEDVSNHVKACLDGVRAGGNSREGTGSVGNEARQAEDKTPPRHHRPRK